MQGTRLVIGCESNFLHANRYLYDSCHSLPILESFELLLCIIPSTFVLSALEHLRKKIEVATEKIKAAKVKEQQSKKVGQILVQSKILANNLYFCKQCSRCPVQNRSSYSVFWVEYRRLQAIIFIRDLLLLA